MYCNQNAYTAEKLVYDRWLPLMFYLWQNQIHTIFQIGNKAQMENPKCIRCPMSSSSSKLLLKYSPN